MDISPRVVFLFLGLQAASVPNFIDETCEKEQIEAGRLTILAVGNVCAERLCIWAIR